jgi:hypothetical protein
VPDISDEHIMFQITQQGFELLKKINEIDHVREIKGWHGIYRVNWSNIYGERCLKNHISSPVKFSWNGKPCIENRIHIDLCEVLRKELVRGTIFKNKSRTLKLQDVSQGVLGKGSMVREQ